MTQPDSSHSDESIYSPHNAIEPIVIEGNGALTIFGLNNHFSEEIPPRLFTRVAPEEYCYTICRINKMLKRHFANNVVWLMCGCFTMCCTLGCSFCPVVYFNKGTLRSLNRILRLENKRLYNNLGLHWSLHKRLSGRFALIEYVLVISFLQKPDIYVPD